MGFGNCMISVEAVGPDGVLLTALHAELEGTLQAGTSRTPSAPSLAGARGAWRAGGPEPGEE